MAKAKPKGKGKRPDYDPARAGKYRSGNEGRHHRGLIHPGYYCRTTPIPYVQNRPRDRDREA